MPPYLAVATPSPTSFWLLGLVGAGLFVVARCFYLLYIHPLSRFPGPKLAAVTELWQWLNSRSGRMGINMRAVHRKYGDIVRVGPNTLSFSSPQAYRDIYGHVKHGERRFLKNKWYQLNGEDQRITRVRDPAAHAEQRRTLSHAFSARALRDQEVIVHQYVDLLMGKLNELGGGGEKPVNVTHAWNWLTFDVIGDLAFGESFDAITQASNRWMQLIYSHLKVNNSLRTCKRLGRPLSALYMRWAHPAAMREDARTHRVLGYEKAKRRLELGHLGRADFFNHLIKGNRLTEGELIGNADILLIAGSETTATTLTGLTFYLLKNPACLAVLTAEVRGAFPSLDDITGDTAQALPYLHGCIEEALRIFPPVTFALPRDCPGAVVDGEYIPEGTVVGSETLAMHTDPRYWVDAESFRPERWDGEGLAGDDKRAFQPFSTGPRACLGLNMAYLELRIVVAKMVWLYDLEMACEIEDWYGACEDYGLWKKPDLLVKFKPKASV